MKTILDYPDGIHRQVPHAIYHGRHLGLVSKSALDRVERTPAHYKAWIDGAVDDVATEAKTFGGLFHMSLLEPERFAGSCIVEPDHGDLRTKAAKERRDAFRQENEGKTYVAPDDMTAMSAMTAAIRANPLAARMLQDGEPELTVLWTDPETGLRSKTRTDYYVRGRRMAVDIKTADNASHAGFKKSVANYGYHVTDALYRGGFGSAGERIDHYVFVVVEKKPPYAVALYTLDSDAIQRGHARVTSSMRTLAECLRNDTWPGYPVTIQTLELPPWAA